MTNSNGTKKELPAADVQLTNGNIFTSNLAFNLAIRMATAFSKSTIVPKDYQGNEANCLIAIEQACRLKISPLMVMQNLYIVNGRPAWSSQFIISMINSSGKYKTEIQFELTGEGDSLACYAYTLDKNSRKVVGPTITMAIAQAEGWLNRNGSKWKTMPEVMIRYRAASFFGRLNCPDLIMGIYSAEEVIELPDDQYSVNDLPIQEALPPAKDESLPATNGEPAPDARAAADGRPPKEISLNEL